MNADEKLCNGFEDRHNSDTGEFSLISRHDNRFRLEIESPAFAGLDGIRLIGKIRQAIRAMERAAYIAGKIDCANEVRRTLRKQESK